MVSRGSFGAKPFWAARVEPDDIGLAFDAEVELEPQLGGALHLLRQRRARTHRIGLLVISEMPRNHGHVLPPRELHHGIRVRNHRQLVVMRTLAEPVERGAGEQLRATHHPVEMIDRDRLGLGDAVDVDIERHAIFDALLHQAPHRLPLWLAAASGFELRSGLDFVHGCLLSLKPARVGTPV